MAGGSAVDQINRGQTEHSALDRMLTHQLSIHIAEVAERPALRGALSRANERRHKNVMLAGHKIVPGVVGRSVASVNTTAFYRDFAPGWIPSFRDKAVYAEVSDDLNWVQAT